MSYIKYKSIQFIHTHITSVSFVVCTKDPFLIPSNPQSQILFLASLLTELLKLFLETEQCAHISHPLTPKQELSKYSL